MSRTVISPITGAAYRNASVPQNCMECPHHETIADPDPLDWFCDDDKAVVCRKTPNPSRDLASQYLSDRHVYRASARSCRPYNVGKEAVTPEWCPLRKAPDA